MDALQGAANEAAGNLLWAPVAADLGIALVCLLLPLGLARLRRRQPHDARLLLLAGACVVAGLAQLVDAWAIWQASRSLHAAATLTTAGAALLLAGLCWRLLPRLPQLLAHAATDSQLQDMGRLGEAEAEVRRLAAVVESSADAIVVKTLDGRITNWNAAAEQMFGYTAAEALGQPVQMLIPPEREAEEMHILASLGRGLQVPPFRTVRIAKDGRRIEVSAQVSPLRDASGRVIGGVKSARDLTHQRQIEAALRHSETRLRLALESAAIGDWEMALDTGRIHRSHRYDECFGLADATQPWDRGRLLAAVEGVALEAPVEDVQRGAVDRHLVVDPDAERLEALELGEDLLVPLEPGELALQLLDDHAGAPERALLRAQDVAVDVVADVEDALAADPHQPLEGGQVAALVGPAALERRRLAELLAARAEQPQRPPLGEEGRLGRAGDDDVEVVPPGRVLGELPVEDERHHRVGVVVQRVGEDEELLAAGAELVEGRAELGVAHHVVGEVLLDDRLERPVPVDRVDGLADVVEQPGVVDALAAPLEEVDDLREQARLRQREERVDPGEARGGEVDLLVAVEPLQLVVRERPRGPRPRWGWSASGRTRRRARRPAHAAP